MIINESIVKEAIFAWRKSLGYSVKHSPEIAPGEPAAKREGYGRLRITLLPKFIAGELPVNRFEAAMKTVP